MIRYFSRLSDTGKQAIILTGGNSLFWLAWAVGSYQAVYLQQVGFSASQLGLLNALTSAVTIASLAFWGMVSDRIGSLRRVLFTLLVTSFAFYALIPVIPTGLPYSSILFLTLVPIIYFFRGSVSTYAENILVRNSNELHLNYGALRCVGSLLFTISGLLISLLLPFVGVPATFWLSAVLIIPVLVLTIKSREPNARPVKKKEKLDLSSLFKNKAYISLLFFGFLFYIAVNCENSFLPYFLNSNNISSDLYVLVLAYRALLEVPFLVLMVRLRRKFPLGLLVAVSAVLMAVECLCLGFFANSLLSVIICATFFGLGNGLYIGSSLNYVYELAPSNLKASAQAFFSAVSSVAGILGNLGGGLVFDAIGANPFYLAVAGVFLLSVALFLFTQRKTLLVKS